MMHEVLRPLKGYIALLFCLLSSVCWGLQKFLPTKSAQKGSIENYHAIFNACNLSNGDKITQIRQYQFIDQSGQQVQNYALIVDNETLSTAVVSLNAIFNCRPVALSPSGHESSNYFKALYNVSIEKMNSLQNAGATHEMNKKRDIYLTVDLCPSSRPMDIELFKKIQGGIRPVPLAVSISGRWLLNHQSDFDALLGMQNSGELEITWVNHSYNHPYDPKLPNNHNFVLMNGVHIETEVFENEKLMLTHGIVPSIFFRFPGLISNKEDMEKIRRWGLLPLGADAWLALGEDPRVGSFILVHGNGNEPAGLTKLYQDMQAEPIMKKMFSDIKQAFQY